MIRSCRYCDHCHFIPERYHLLPDGRKEKFLSEMFFCRRYPQREEQQVNPDYWCGEFKEKA